MTNQWDTWESPVLDGKDGGLVQFKIYLTKNGWLALCYRFPIKNHTTATPPRYRYHRYYKTSNGLVKGFKRRAKSWGVDVGSVLVRVTQFARALAMAIENKELES